MPTDPDLTLIVSLWGAMPEAVKAGIVAMVKAAQSHDREGGCR